MKLTDREIIEALKQGKIIKDSDMIKRFLFYDVDHGFIAIYTGDNTYTGFTPSLIDLERDDWYIVGELAE